MTEALLIVNIATKVPTLFNDEEGNFLNSEEIEQI